MKTKSDNESQLNRRDFIKSGSLASVVAMLGGSQLSARKARAEQLAQEIEGEAIGCGIIGIGPRGREHLAALSRLPQARVVAVCDHYGPSLRRGSTAAPGAAAVSDYEEVLQNEEVQAVIIATPTHQHREITEAALQAGKHVYCEAPLAHTVDDARAMARAAQAAPNQIFQAGLQFRSDPLRHDLVPFIRAGAMGRSIKARAQWHKKQSWRFASPVAEREREINWRLRQETSPGLIGEIGIHQLDTAAWFWNTRPVAVSGLGSLIYWRDGRDVPDTVHAVLEYPRGIHMSYDSTLANSFDAYYEMFYGTDSAIMVRDNKAWMFKEVDSPLLGWEVYARKDLFYNETGIALVANATQLEAQGDNPVQDAPYPESPLHYALEAFLHNVKQYSEAIEDFTATFDVQDEAMLQEYLSDLLLLPYASYREGYEATVVALTANEAVKRSSRIAIEEDLYKI
jgi:predicted dehydrogenase